MTHVRRRWLWDGGVILLTFGQILLHEPQVMFFNATYVFMAAALLFLEKYDTWVLYPRRRTELLP